MIHFRVRNVFGKRDGNQHGAAKEKMRLRDPRRDLGLIKWQINNDDNAGNGIE